MNGFQKNRFLILYLAIVILGVGGLGYFVYQSKSSLDTVTQEYDEAVHKLQSLQTRKPFPDEKNLAQVKEQQAKYKAAIKNLTEELGKKNLPVKEMSQQVFQDRLRQVVSEINKKASEQNVKLPENFYMGFDLYKDSPPPAQAATALGHQLEVINLVVNKLIDLKVRGIISLSRKALPHENGGAASTAKRIVSLYPFDIVFETDQGKFRQLFNAILDSEQFFIIRNLAILNSHPEGPLRKDDKQAPSPAHSNVISSGKPVPGGAMVGAIQAGEPTTSNNLRVVVGRETLFVDLNIDQVDFDLPEIK